MLSVQIVAPVRELGVAKDAVEPACRRRHGLGLRGSELVSGAGDGQQVDPRIAAGDPHEDGERPELVALSLHDERRAGDRRESGLVPRTGPVRRRDRMTEDHQRIWRLALGEERAHAAPERTADESDALGVNLRHQG